MVEPTFAPPPPAPSAPPAKKLHWGRLVAFIVVIVLLLCGGVAALVAPSLLAVDDVKADAGKYLTAMQNGDFAAAYDRICSSVRGHVSSTALQNLPRLNGYEITSTSVRFGFGRASRASVIAHLYLTDNQTELHRFDLVHEDGQWRVCE
jgi:ABC-type transporter Mla maintaining outer membrane lipid asymmetry permease subunit MlaE